MKKQLRNKEAVILLTAFSIPIIWFAVLAAQCCGEGIKLFGFLENLSEILKTPYRLKITPYTGKCVLICLCCYGIGISAYYSSKGNKRIGEEYGSAKWGNAAVHYNKYMVFLPEKTRFSPFRKRT